MRERKAELKGGGMARKKTLIVRCVTKGRNWSIECAGSDSALKSALAGAVRNAALEHNAVLLNASDPFGGLVAPKARKARGKGGKPADGAGAQNGGERQATLG